LMGTAIVNKPGNAKMGIQNNTEDSITQMLITITYKSTHCHFIDTGNGLLAFDAGWPDTYGEYRDGLKGRGYRTGDIRWLIVSHFHIDHAGLAGMLVDNGVRFVVFRNQVGAIGEMESLIERKKMTYHRLDTGKIKVMEISESRAWLESIGVRGEVLHTDGHGDQCVSLLLDSGEAFTGDLAPENMIADDDVRSRNSWELLKSKGAKYIKPAHGIEYKIG
jgi:endoribonuclease LACTB2